MSRFMREGAAWLLGFAVLISYQTMASVVGRGVGEVFEPMPWVDAAGRLLQVVVCLAVALSATRGCPLVRSSALGLACVAACSAAPVLVLAGSFFPSPAASAFVAAGHLLRSGGYLVLWLAWMELYARIDLRHMLVCYLVVHVCSAGLSLALSGVLVPAFSLAIAALPWVSHAMWRKASAVVDRAAFACGEREPHPWAFPVAPVVLMVAFTTVNLFVRSMLPGEAAVYATAGVVVACLAMLAFVQVRGMGSFDIWRLGDAAFVFSLMGLLGTHLVGPGWAVAASLCTNAGFALFTVFVAAALCNVSYRYGVNSMVLFGFAKAAECLAYFLGSALARAAGRAQDDGFTLIVILLAAFLAVSFVVLAGGRGRDLSWGVGFDPRRAQGGPRETSLEQRCSAISRECGLTRREEEVLALLARDLPASEIERLLCVTNATVKTHTQAVYRKLGVHSRKEIVALVGGDAPRGAVQVRPGE